MLSVIDEMLIGLAWKLEEGVKWGLTRGWEGEYFGVSAAKTNHIRALHNRIHTDRLVAAPRFMCTCSVWIPFLLAQTDIRGWISNQFSAQFKYSWTEFMYKDRVFLED